MKKNHKYFIGYLYNDYKVKALHIMRPKTSTYVKDVGGQAKWVYYVNYVMDVYANSALIWKGI